MGSQDMAVHIILNVDVHRSKIDRENWEITENCITFIKMGTDTRLNSECVCFEFWTSLAPQILAKIFFEVQTLIHFNQLVNHWYNSLDKEKIELKDKLMDFDLDTFKGVVPQKNQIKLIWDIVTNYILYFSSCFQWISFCIFSYFTSFSILFTKRRHNWRMSKRSVFMFTAVFSCVWVCCWIRP